LDELEFHDLAYGRSLQLKNRFSRGNNPLGIRFSTNKKIENPADQAIML
jgi:hypothetical protein